MTENDCYSHEYDRKIVFVIHMLLNECPKQSRAKELIPLLPLGLEFHEYDRKTFHQQTIVDCSMSALLEAPIEQENNYFIHSS